MFREERMDTFPMKVTSTDYKKTDRILLIVKIINCDLCQEQQRRDL